MRQLSRLWKKVTTSHKKAALVLSASALMVSFGPASQGGAAAQPAPLPVPNAGTTAAAALERPADARVLSFHNLHTEERVTATYWQNGAYDTNGVSQISDVLRDHRRNEVQSISVDLLDYLYTIQQELEPQYPNSPMVFEVISGYRAAETTNELRRGGAAVANDASQHQFGHAMDFRIDGVPLRELRDTAWCLQRGGVGYYPESHNNFIHVDVGRVRFWPASRRAWACMS